MPGRKKKQHQPSMYRKLVRQLKSGTPVQKIIDSSRGLEDPYYRSLFLFKLSSDRRIPLERALELAFDSLETSDLEGREWRRGELLTEISHILKGWREDGDEEKKRILWEGIVHRLKSFENGEVISNSVAEISKHIPGIYEPSLLEISLKDVDGSLKGPKSVIRNWIGRDSQDQSKYPDPEGNFGDPITRSRLLGYASLQARKAGNDAAAAGFIEGALKALSDVKKEERSDILRYLVECSPFPEGFEKINDILTDIKTPEILSATYSSMGVRSHREGDMGTAREYLEMAERSAGKIEDDPVRRRTYRDLSEAVEKLGDGDWAAELKKSAAAGETDHESGRIDGWIDEKDETVKGDRERPEEVIPMERKAEKGRAVIGLYDTYEGSIKSIHHRMIARAAPLCWAFDFDLALIGFPTNNLDKLIEGTIKETNVGKGGEFLRQLVDSVRIQLVEGTWKDPPKDWKTLGLPVATTSHPDHQKAVGMEQAVRTASVKHPLKRVCLIMGLGKRGLPNSMLRSAHYHLELTGVNVPLETSTALGVISERLRCVLDSG
ncbi:MAG: DUF531 family protein [Thermoplasmatota archaeon]